MVISDMVLFVRCAGVLVVKVCEGGIKAEGLGGNYKRRVVV